MQREQHVARAFVELADTLVADFDVTEFLHTLVDHCVELLDVAAAGLALTDQRGAMQAVAASTEEAKLVELFEQNTAEGPCVDCFTTATPILVPDIADRAASWPRFAEAARQCGFVSVHALPLRLREETIGALNLFGESTGTLSPEDLQLGQALADIATIGILQQRAIHSRDLLTGQLQTALTSRVAIEQAKGIVAGHLDIDLDQAFRALRRYCRDTNTRLHDLARAVIEQRTTPDAIWSRVPPAPDRGPRQSAPG